MFHDHMYHHELATTTFLADLSKSLKKIDILEGPLPSWLLEKCHDFSKRTKSEISVSFQGQLEHVY